MKRLSLFLLLAAGSLAISGSGVLQQEAQFADKKGGGTGTSIPVREDVQFADKKGGGTGTSIPVREDYA